MAGNTKTYPFLGTAVLLVALALGALSVPPLELVRRVDRVFYDLWSRAAPPSAPDDIVIVSLDDPTWYETLARIALQQNARLLISTLPEPSAYGADLGALGPVAIAAAGSQLLRETTWKRGGYLWPQPDFDGVIRHERPLIDESSPVPSLALAGSIALQLPEPLALGGLDAHGYSGPLTVDAEGRRWLRYFDRESFRTLTPAEVLAAPSDLEDKIVIVGQNAGEHHSTPIGTLTTQELLAHELAGYRLNTAVTTGIGSLALVWGLAVLLLLAVPATRLSPAAKTAAPVLGAGVLVAGSAAAFIMEGLWYPAAGPALLALMTGSYGAWAQRRRPEVVVRDTRAAPKLQEARRLAARGSGVDAWRLYKQLRPEAAQVTELYELGRSMDLRGEHTIAADIFNRISQIDPLYRDVSKRLHPAAENDDLHTDQVEAPKMLGRYHLLKKIGRGAMGLVYLGRDPKINRMVAIKTIDLAKEFELEDIDEVRERFLREAETAGALSHPDIVTIFDAGEENNIAYIAMELLRGRHLSDYTQVGKLLPVPTTIELAARAARALEYAHRNNIVHRDIKPSNIMYDSGTDALKLTDFGIARLMDVSRTRTGIILGTPSFMSPEQLEGKNVSGHADIFALGVSLYQLLTGHLPFRGTSMTELMFVIANEPHRPVTAIRPDLPSRLDAILDRALAKKPADRFATGADMAHALRDVAAQAA